MPITPRSGGIDGTCATPTISARSHFARSTIKHRLLTTSVALLDLGRARFPSARSRHALAAENFFLRKQLVLFQERKVKPRRTDDTHSPLK